MKTKNLKEIKRDIHTSKEYADYYDKKIVGVIPHYDEMLEHSALSIPFRAKDEFSVLELGYGTGNLTAKILCHYPKVHLIGIDYSPHMARKARAKLAAHGLHDGKCEFICEDITKYNFISLENKINVIIGTLIFHDLTPNERDDFFKKAFKILSRKGAIVIGDVIGLNSPEYRARALRKWVRFLRQGMKLEEIAKFLRHPEMREMLEATTVHDHHQSLANHNLGKSFEVSWKLNNFAVITSYKA